MLDYISDLFSTAFMLVSYLYRICTLKYIEEYTAHMNLLNKKKDRGALVYYPEKEFINVPTFELN